MKVFAKQIAKSQQQLSFVVNDGTRLADIYVTVDFEAIALELASRAMKNKSRQSRAMRGAVIVEATNIGRAV